MQCIRELVLLKVDPGQPVRGIVTYDLIHRALENGPDRTSCTVVHSVTQFKIAERKFSVVDMVIERVEFRLVYLTVLFDFGIKALECFEEQSLVRIIERLTEVQILQFLALTWARCQTGE